MSRFVSIWFPHLRTDWFALKRPELKKIPFVLRSPSHGRMMITAANAAAEKEGIREGMVLADARAILPDLAVEDDKPELMVKLLKRLAEWSIRFTPIAAIDPPNGLLLDVSGCPHLWRSETNYLNDILRKLTDRGYHVKAAMADTPGAAWALARFAKGSQVIESGRHVDALMSLPAESLRLESETIERLHKLGLTQVGRFFGMPRSSLRRRFGPQFISRLNKAIGLELEVIEPVVPIEPYQERLPCLEPIVTATGIEIALKQLLETLCLRLQQEQKGLRHAVLRCFRVDGKVEQISIGTHRPTHHVAHLFKLFEPKLSGIAPGLGIDLFVLEAPKVEDHLAQQEKMWDDTGGLDDIRLSELIDRLSNRVGAGAIRRYLPDEHYWPERSIRQASSLQEKTTTTWRADKLRPLQLLRNPEPIDVTAPIPDYPPMVFVYKGKEHRVTRADGPERIEQEWWLQQGQHRDYYRVEDEDGNRYWLFRLGHYDDQYQWFLHGWFA